MHDHAATIRKQALHARSRRIAPRPGVARASLPGTASVKTANLEDARTLLWFHWGHSAFRPGQSEAIEAALAHRDVLAVLPTGAGKSVCYQVPALLLGGTTLVISPLVALMQDQVDALRSRGISAACITAGLSSREVDQRWTDVEFGRYSLVYVSPERLGSEMFLARAARFRIALMAIDEAHCISTWGHQFRPAYRQIRAVYPLIGRPPVMAVTATATPEVRRDIEACLELRRPCVIVKGFDRPNIHWAATETAGLRKAVLEEAGGLERGGIVYAMTRQAAEAMAGWIRKRGQSTEVYHAGLAPAARKKAQERWLSGQARIMVATSAFGMGIDKPDVRLVVHAGLPPSLEAYYQEAGRAGRDGKPARALLLSGPGDESRRRQMTDNSYPNRRQIRVVYEAACNLAQVAVGELPAGPLLLDVRAVTAATSLPRSVVQEAANLLAEQQVWHVSNPGAGAALLRLTEEAGALRSWARKVSNRSLESFVFSLLRRIPAEAYRSWRAMDLERLAKGLGLQRRRLEAGLDFLAQRGMLQWKREEAALQLQLIFPRTDRLAVDDKAVREGLLRARQRIDQVARYLRTRDCRRRFLLRYLGERSAASCNRCDRCQPAARGHA